MKQLLRTAMRVLGSPAVIIMAAFLLRFGVMYYTYATTPSPGLPTLKYGYETGAVAASIASGHGFSSPFGEPTGPTAWFTPVYPYLLAGVFKIFGTYSFRSLLVMVTINCICSAFTCLPIYSIGREAFSRAVGIGAAWFWVFQPSGVFFPLQWIWDTSLTALLLALLVWASLWVRQATRLTVWAGYGALWALSAMVNPSVLSVLPVLLYWLIWRRPGDLGRQVRLVGAAMLVMLAGCAPWIVRNSLVFGTFVGLRSNFGLELYIGNNESTNDSLAWEVHPNDSLKERAVYKRMGEIAFMKEKQREAIHYIVTHPGAVARWTFKRFVHTWTGTTDPAKDLWPHAIPILRVFIVYNYAFPVLTLLGLFFASRTRNIATLPLASVIFCYPLVYYITHASLRYRHPIDPVMAVLTTYAVVYPLSQLARRGKAQSTTLGSRLAARGYSEAG